MKVCRADLIYLKNEHGRRAMKNNEHIKEILADFLENKKIGTKTKEIYSLMLENDAYKNISDRNIIDTKNESWFAENQSKRTILFDVPEILTKEHRRSIESVLSDIQKQINMTLYEFRNEITKKAIQIINEKTSQIPVPEKQVIDRSPQKHTSKRKTIEDTVTALSAEKSSRILTKYWSDLYSALSSVNREIQSECIKNRVVTKEFWWTVDYATVDVNNTNHELAEKITQGINSSSIPLVDQYIIKNTVVECVKTAMKLSGNEITNKTYNAPIIEANAQYDGLVAGWHMAKVLCSYKPAPSNTIPNKTPKPK